MTNRINLENLLSQAGDKDQQVTSFALLCLGIVESLSSGLIGVKDSPIIFFHAENCLFILKTLKEKIADQIMSHGVQLPDLFDSLPTGDAQREFQRELAKLHSLCLRLLEDRRVAA
jgi:hypothetical protein